MLTNKKALAKTSAAPGKTQLINHFSITSTTKSGTAKKNQYIWYLVDLPGYGYAKVSQKQRKSWGQMIEQYILNRTNLGNLFVLIDSRHEPQAIDLEFINQLGQWQVPFCIVFTKADKNKPGATKRNADQFLNALKESWEQLPPAFITSSINAEGKADVLNFIEELNTQYREFAKQ